MFSGSCSNLGENYNPHSKREGIKLIFTGDGIKLADLHTQGTGSILTPLDQQNI
jgi:hypothetical protein